MTENLDITKPLRLATGSHGAGSGKGCAMNLISWEQGDTTITDYPACAARPLARLVQCVNDWICAHSDDGLLCLACSMTVLDLAHATVGTADATREQQATWWAELLESPDWGIARWPVTEGEAHLVHRLAQLYRCTAAGHRPSRAEWAVVHRAATPMAEVSLVAGVVHYAAGAEYAADGHPYPDEDPADFAEYYNEAIFVARSLAARRNCDDGLLMARSAIDSWHRICGTGLVRPPPEIVSQAVTAMRQGSELWPGSRSGCAGTAGPAR